MVVTRFETRGWFVILTLVLSACGGGSPSSGGAGANGKGGAGVGIGGAGAGGRNAQAAGGAPAGGGGRGGAGGTPAHGGAPGTAGAGGMAPVSGATNMAKACATDTDCGAGLVCLKATDKLIGTLGGPSNGYCTMTCTSLAEATACEAAGGLCLDLSAAGDATVGYCLKNCKFGDTDGDSKCQARTDVGCGQVYNQNGDVSGAVCIPLCAQDSDCPTGRKCDPMEGFCVDTPHAGDPMGAHCTADPMTGASACAGYCQGIGDENNKLVASFCTRRCVLGQLGCNIVGANMSVAGGMHGVCAYGSDPTADLDDLGFCTVECDSVDDCPNKTDPNPVCETAQTMSVIGHGICSWN